MSSLGAPKGAPGPDPQAGPGAHLGHVHLEVRDLDESVLFYQELLGLEVTERAGRFAFLSFGAHHHDLALQQVPDARFSGDDGDTRPGLYHVAFEVPTMLGLEHVTRHLRTRGRAHDLVDHGISVALYTRDPDGHGVEVYVDRRRDPEGRASWKGVSEGVVV